MNDTHDLVRATVQVDSPLLDGPLVMDFICADDDAKITRRALMWCFHMYRCADFLGRTEWVTITKRTPELAR